MNVKRLKELLENKDDDLEIFIRNSKNVCGNISKMRQIELSTYSFFGQLSKCLILHTSHTSKDLERDVDGYIIDEVEVE